MDRRFGNVGSILSDTISTASTELSAFQIFLLTTTPTLAPFQAVPSYQLYRHALEATVFFSPIQESLRPATFPSRNQMDLDSFAGGVKLSSAQERVSPEGVQCFSQKSEF